MFLFALCNGMFMMIAQNLYIDKVCLVNLRFDEEICKHLTNQTNTEATEAQIVVQKYVSELQAYSGILQVWSELRV